MNGFGTNLFQAFRLCPPFVPTEPVSTCSSIKRAHGLPSAEVSGCAAAPQMRGEAAAGVGDFARDFDDDLGLDSAFFLGKLGRELRVVTLERIDDGVEALALRAEIHRLQVLPSSSSSSRTRHRNDSRRG